MSEILLVDDEPTIRLAVGDALRDAGYSVRLAEDGNRALEQLERGPADLVISDIRMPGLDGLSLFQRIREKFSRTAVILITAYGDVHDAVSAMRDGASDYLTKPFDNEELLLRVAKIAEHQALARELGDARRELARLEEMPAIIGRSPPILRLLERIETMAGSDLPVMINGESGTGKELVARQLHALSERRNGPFMAVNCAAFPESLLEAELFGHEKGAFTGAVRRREGRFKAAHGGTLLLDEVAEIPLLAQAKLLRVLQEGKVEPLGSNLSVDVDVRVVSATHRNLKERIAGGLFRDDLYYRINVLDVRVPPLRERKSDLPLLAQHFLSRRRAPGAELPPITPRCWAALSEYDFPGNVRELEHAIEHARVLSGGKQIDLEHLPRDIVGDQQSPDAEQHGMQKLSAAIAAFERQYLLRALGRSGRKKKTAAALLGISRKNLWEKLKSHGITDADF